MVSCPSPNIQCHAVIVPPLPLLRSVKVTAELRQPGEDVLNPAIGEEDKLTAEVIVAMHPEISVMVRVTTYVPGCSYTCGGSGKV